MIYDLIIIGGGPAGTAAAVYAARKRLKTLLVAGEFGGQSNVSEDIQNWIGTPHIKGGDFAVALKKHMEEYRGEFLDIREGVWVTGIEKKDNTFVVKADSDNLETRSVLITTGGSRRKLEATGAAEFENKGITYCASCDGPLFADQDVVVVGGGNAAFETAAQLLAYCKSVTMLHRSENFRADPITVEKVLADPKMKALKNIEILEIKGEKFVSSIIFKDKMSGETTELPTTGIFVEIGHIPNTHFVKDLLTLDTNNKIVTDPMNQHTSVEGIWCAGDASNGLYHQNNIAAGDAVKALEDIYLWVHKHK